MGSEKVFTTAPSPESAGIPSRAILNFLRRIDAERICMHGFLLVRHNRIAAEGYWAPWSAERMHRIYSVSKSLVALAVGMMIDEGRLTLDDRVAFYFPDKLPEELHPWLAAATVRDLLTMATPFRLQGGRDRRLYDQASRVVLGRIQWIRRRKASLT